MRGASEENVPETSRFYSLLGCMALPACRTAPVLKPTECSLSPRKSRTSDLIRTLWTQRGPCWNALSSTLDQSAATGTTPPRTAVTLTICPVTTLLYAVDHAPADMVVSFTPGSELLRKRLLWPWGKKVWFVPHAQPVSSIC